MIESQAQDEPTRIAVVEDDHEIRELVVAYLARDGFETRGFPNGAAFDQDHAAFAPHLVVLDLMMPGEDGLSMCRRIGPTTPVLVLSAKGDEVDRIVGLEVGADDYLPKPFNPRELVARDPRHSTSAQRWCAARRTCETGPRPSGSGARARDLRL